MPACHKDITPRNKKYLEWLKTQPCAYPGCNRFKDEYMDIVPAHQNLDGGFMAGKSNDMYALGLCSEHHVLEHQQGSKTFWNGIYKEKLIIDNLIKFVREYPK